MTLIDFAVVFLPLIGAIIAGFGGHRLGDRGAQIVTTFGVSLAAVLSVFVFSQSFILLLSLFKFP